MIDESRNSSSLCGIDDGVLVDSEEITAADSALQVSSFSHIGNLLTHFLSDILDDHVIGSDVFLGIQAPIMDGRASEAHRLLALLKLIESKNVSFAVRSGKGLLLRIDVCNEPAVVDSR